MITLRSGYFPFDEKLHSLYFSDRIHVENWIYVRLWSQSFFCFVTHHFRLVLLPSPQTITALSYWGLWGGVLIEPLTHFLRLSNSWVTLLCDHLVCYVASVSCIVLKWELVWVNSVLSASVWSSKIVWPLVGHIADRSNCYLCLRCDPPVSIIVFDHPWVTSQCDKSEPQRYFRFDHRVFWSKQKLSEMVF